MIAWLVTTAHGKRSMTFTGRGCTKSALTETEKIYKRAKADNNSAEMVKSLIHRVRFIQEVEEESFVLVQATLEKELKDATSMPMKPLLHSMMAELYWNYYQQNRWTFLNRTATVDFKQTDMRTWDLKKIVEAVMTHYEESLKNAEETKKDIDQYI
ncbi:MAG: hypothetical protein MZV63_15195 [Marinilabiliales bacterium]|nr:hypothetical protein [Marinilabiliales bacterium]